MSVNVYLHTQNLAKSWAVLNKVGGLIYNKDKKGEKHTYSKMSHDPCVMVQQFVVLCVDKYSYEQKDAGQYQDVWIEPVSIIYVTTVVKKMLET